MVGGISLIWAIPNQGFCQFQQLPELLVIVHSH